MTEITRIALTPMDYEFKQHSSHIVLGGNMFTAKNIITMMTPIVDENNSIKFKFTYDDGINTDVYECYDLYEDTSVANFLKKYGLLSAEQIESIKKNEDSDMMSQAIALLTECSPKEDIDNIKKETAEKYESYKFDCSEKNKKTETNVLNLYQTILNNIVNQD